ncbi:MAG: type IV pilus twitching motility protein PilT [Labilithrix sp.]|nr:type IV pilus twitching motility protein PilT [Labilithrix sp.]MCW5811939.1 type IV pilus twitching motility protein PilT [Labilithrix sp.]
MRPVPLRPPSIELDLGPAAAPAPAAPSGLSREEIERIARDAAAAAVAAAPAPPAGPSREEIARIAAREAAEVAERIVLEAMPRGGAAQAAAAAPKGSLQAAATRSGPAKIDGLLREMIQRKASDLHLSAGVAPVFRVDGEIHFAGGSAPGGLSSDDIEAMVTEVMTPKAREDFASLRDADYAYELRGLARFRVNVFQDRNGVGAVLRQIPIEVLTAEKLGLPKACLDMCWLSKGLVLVTGPTGSGKSTTLAAMIDFINKNRSDHIITIEDPVEFVHQNQKCLVNQREVGLHTKSFKNALRAALREDPDIVLVGEMRDLETISIAIETAETGHLVFGTLHTTTAVSTVDRIIDQFPSDRQSQIRVMLSESLKGVVAQNLIPKIGGGRVAAQEILVGNHAVAALIRDGKTFQLPSVMQTGKNIGMVTMNDALMKLVMSRQVDPQQAYIKAVDKTGFAAMLKSAGINSV